MTELPPNVRRALSVYPGPTAIPIETNGDETVVICKAELAGIASLRRPGVNVSYRYELARYPEGSVIRLVFEFQDRPGRPYTGETFFNPASEYDLPLLRHLARQERLTFAFYDLQLRPAFAKQVAHRNMVRSEIEKLTSMALEHNATLDPSSLNFVAATYKMQKES